MINARSILSLGKMPVADNYLAISGNVAKRDGNGVLINMALAITKCANSVSKSLFQID